MVVLAQTSEEVRRRAVRRHGWLVVGLAGLLVFSLGAQPGGASAAAKDTVVRATLDNGLRVVIVPNRLAPVATTVVNYLAGSNEAPEGFPGMAHALEHMMFRGSPGLSADQLAAIGANMGGMFNADTQQTVTQYFFTVPAEDLHLPLRIEAIRMKGVLATDALWNKERGAIEQEVAQDLSNPEYVSYTRLLNTLFKGTPYAHDALGTRASFNRTTGAMLRRFHKTWYAPNNAVLVIAGDVDPQEALEQVRRLFGGIPLKKLPRRADVSLQPVKPERISLETDQPDGAVLIAFRTPGFDSPDYPAAQILSDVLSSQRGALYGLVPQGKALDASFNLTTLPQAGLGYAVVSFPRGGDADALVREVRDILAATVKEGVSADLVEAAKRQEVAAAEFRKNSVAGLAMLWSQAVAVEGRKSPGDDLAAIKAASVADVKRVARRYLDLDRAVVAVLTPKASGEPVATKGLRRQESFAARNVAPVELPAWAENAFKRLSVPPSAVHPTVTTLSNGIRLIVQPERVSNTIGLYGHIRNEPALEQPRGKEGVDEVLGQLMSYGTTSLDHVSFQKALDDIAANASAGTDFSVQVLRDRFDRGVQLLADNELHPALPDNAFGIVRREVAAAVAGRLQSPDFLMRQALHAALYPKHDPSLRTATPRSVSSLTLRDVKDYYRHVYRPDLTTIVVIGDVTPAAARRTIEKYFGAWKASGPAPETLLPPVPPNEPGTTFIPDSSRIQNQVVLAETLGLNRFNPDYYALELGNHVLGGGFYATRLYRDLREAAGLVYYVSSSFDVDRTRAVYQVDYACDPPNVSKVHTIVARELKKMQTAPVTADELRQAKAALLRKIPLSESSTDAIAAGLIYRATHDLPLDEPTRAARQYMHLTAAQVRSAFAKWLRPDDLVRVSKGPMPK